MAIKRTFPKILGLIASSSLFFILLFSVLFYFTNKAEQDVYDYSTKRFKNEVDKLLMTESKPIWVAINIDTNWDEFVDFIQTKDLSWYKGTINKEIPIYKASYLGVYDLQRQFITRTPTSKINSTDIIPKQVMNVLDKVGRKKFYVKIPEGIAEVTGAAIHPSNDPTKTKTKSRGYFFVLRLMDKTFLEDLGKLTNSEIQFVASKKELIKSKNTIQCLYQLKGENNQVVGTLLFKRNFETYFENTIQLLYLLIGFFVFNLVISLIYAKKLLYHPLDLVRSALISGDQKAIDELKNTTGEFSYIGNLFEENNNQKIELINAKIKAEEGERLKSAFLANLSHEIRTPMNAINGFTELILNTKISENEKLEYLNVIERSGKNLVSIIDDLIEMSKIDSNQITPNYSKVNLESCINDLYETIKVTIPKDKAIEFALIKSSAPAEFNIITDETKLKQVIVNLVNNAIKFTEKGRVSFGYEMDKKKNEIHFTIRDTGLGIDEAQHSDIFDRFKRIDSEISIKAGGLGLGLAISKAYIEILGGTISLESKIGEGTTFYFSIPLQYSEAEHIIVKPVKEFEISKSESKIILIAEDDNINFLLFQKMMQNSNHQIIRAVNGQEAVDNCLNNPNVDLVLMDIKMPIMDGFEAITQIRPIRPNLPIIAQTAYASSEDRSKIEAAGFDDYITKPLNRERLFELIDNYLNQK